MKTASVALQNALKQGVVLKAQPQLIVEWNQNRYAPLLEVKNVTDSSAPALTQECYPINSIAESMRPESAGIIRTWASSGTRTRLPFTEPVSSVRAYTADPTSLYKYWVSDNRGNGSGAITNVTPRVVYSVDTWVNKISVCFERYVSYPTAYTIEYTVNGTSWTVAATNVAVPPSGRVDIYRQSGGTWSTSVFRDAPLKIRGVRVNITTLNVPNERAAVIEVSPRLESDLSALLIDVSDSFSMSEASMVAPLGIASSNSASVTLSNTGGEFNNENVSSLYYGLIDVNAKFILNYVYDLTSFGGGLETVRQFTMFSEDWGGDDEESISVSLKDASKFLQEIKPNAVYWPEVTAPAVIANLCDTIGFSSWSYDDFNSQAADEIDHFWTDGEKTAWQVFNEVAEPTQTALFFDEFGVLRIRTRQAAYNDSAPVAWALSSTGSGPDLANIISLEKTNDFEANSVRVKYLGTKISEPTNGYPAMEIVWEPSDTVVLRSSNLGSAITSGSAYVKINPTETAFWNYAGFVMIDGEVIEYDAKGYFYTNTSGSIVHAYVTSNDEKKNIDTKLSSPALAFTNKFSGYLRIKKRGCWGTPESDHSLGAEFYTKEIDRVRSAAVSPWVGGTTIDPLNSVAKVRTTNTFTWDHRYINKVNVGGSGTYRYFGTRFKFLESGYTQGAAGLGFNLGSGNTGYYVDVRRTSSITAAERASTPEVYFYIRTAPGAYQVVPSADGSIGAAAAISPGTWYDLDVTFTVETNGSHTVEVFLNGLQLFSVNITANQRPPSSVAAFFTRGFTYADFEYLYGYGGTSEDVRFDDSTYYDYIEGGFGSARWDEVIAFSRVINPFTRKSAVIAYSTAQSKFFDDFGPIVHEIRQFNVKFDKAPNVHSNLYFSNTSQVACLDYNSTPFGASFTMVNKSRENAILVGEDTLTFGIDSPVDQKMMVYGRLVSQDDEQETVVSDPNGIRARGIIETEISSGFIQSEGTAKSIANWIVTSWSSGNDEVAVSIFGNPLIVLGDIVTVEYPIRGMTAATHRYFVVGVSSSFDGGISTSLTLRRIKV